MELFDQMAAPEKQEEALIPQQGLVWVRVPQRHDTYYLVSMAHGVRYTPKGKLIAFRKVIFEELIREGRFTRESIITDL